LPHVFGIVALKPVIDSRPSSIVILKVIGSFWLLRIGLRMASVHGSPEVRSEERPMRFLAALLFQFANPKAITGTVALVSLVLVPTKHQPWLLGAVVLIIPPLCFLANGLWALVGQNIRRMLSTAFHWKVFNVMTGAMTAVCTVFLWI
jgi:threonine/homoserine/homoserine lactone efflux protein